MHRCLIISPYFPPSTLAGVHRARHLAKHLVAHGWEPTIISVDPWHHAEALDPALRALVPSCARIVETGAIPIKWTEWLGLRGEIGLRGFFHLRAEIARQLQLRKSSVVLITGSPFYPMLLSSWIQRRFGVPVVLDLQDPWASKEGATRNRWTKGWLAHKLAVSLEPRALAGAAWITSVSALQNAELAARYPWLNASRMSAIPIGGDAEDFASIVRHCVQPSDGAILEFSYVGSAWPRALPLLSLLFEGLAKLRDRAPATAARLKLRFVGTSPQPGQSTDFRVLPLAKSAGVGDLVTEQPGRVGFLEALRILVDSHAVLMIGSDEPHYTASKIYPGLMSGRPFFSFFHKSSSAHAILVSAGGGIAIPFDGHDSRERVVDDIAAALYKLASDATSLGRANPAAYADYTAHAVAGQFAEVFDVISTANSPAP